MYCPQKLDRKILLLGAFKDSVLLVSSSIPLIIIKSEKGSTLCKTFFNFLFYYELILFFQVIINPLIFLYKYCSSFLS